MSKSIKNRKKSGKIKSWEVLMRCEFSKMNNTNSLSYIETWAWFRKRVF